MFYENNLITKPNSNKATEKQSKTKCDIPVVVYILSDIVVAPQRRCQGPNNSVSPRGRVMVAKALRNPSGYNAILAPMAEAGLSTLHATKGIGDMGSMMQPSCMLAYL